MEMQRVSDSLARSLTVKIALVFAIGLMFFIPWAMVWGLVVERTSRRAEAAAAVGASWGGSQELGGVVLNVPYHEPWIAAAPDKSRPEQPAHDGVVRLLPDLLDVQVRMDPDVRYRGMFPVRVYTARVQVSGRFILPPPNAMHVLPEHLLWDRAVLRIGMKHTKSINPDARLVWNGTSLPLTTAMESLPGLVDAGLEVPVPDPRTAAAAPDGLPFSLTLELRGTGALTFQPSGKVTTVAVSSPWPDASFTGAFLPDAPRSGPQGFEAKWRLGSFGRGYPQVWRDGESRQARPGEFAPATLKGQAEAASFGAELITTVDPYQQTERSVKYGMLFVGLTFLLFLLSEVLRGVRVHPVQYMLVGGALLVFYLLLLSLSEQIGFGLAYLAASTATVLLIAMYAGNAFGTRRDGLQTGACLAGLYGTLFVLVRLEDYALLAGALLLFFVIAGVMYLTRRIDWYGGRATI